MEEPSRQKKLVNFMNSIAGAKKIKKKKIKTWKVGSFEELLKYRGKK